MPVAVAATTLWQRGGRSPRLFALMIDQPFRSLLDRLAARTPTPGGGAAAALAACMGTALLLMVVRFSRGKKANAARDTELAAAEDQLHGCLMRLEPMAERDCGAFDMVSRAYGMPKDSAAEQAMRQRAIQEAMIGAMIVPEETLCMVRDVHTAMAGVTDCVGKNIVSDLASGSSLLVAAAEGAFLNVRINAIYLDDRALAASTMERATAVLAEIRNRHSGITARVESMLA